jgi:branched-chain amino acid aminotransferase
MSRGALLYAVTDAGPCPLQVPAGASGFEGLYEGLDLGVYEAMRTFGHHRFLELDGHVARTRRSLERMGWDYVFDEARMRRCLDRACRAAPFAEMRVRFDVLAAPACVRGSDSRELIALVPFTPPGPEVYERGVAVVTTSAIARPDPLTKTAEFVERRRRIERQTPQAYERLIVDPSGEILEGFSSNFYVVLDGVLVTAGEGVLEGVTRRIVLALAAEAGVPVRLAPPRAAAIAQVQEAAISSSSRGLVPVVRIDGHAVGEGVPGPVIRALSASYDAFVAGAVRPAV